MSWQWTLGFVVFAGSFLGGRFWRERAGLRLLTVDQRNQITTLGALRSAARMILAMGLVLWLLPLGLKGWLPSVPSWLEWLAIVLAAVWLHVSYFQRLRALGLPATYVRAHEHARYAVYAGCALGVVLMSLASKRP